MKRLLLFSLFIASFAPRLVQAQDMPVYDPATIDVPYKKFVLPNGLHLIVHEDHKAPIAAVNVWYHVGSKNEKPGKSGFAHLFEHLMFSGSEHVASGEHLNALQAVGGIVNATTWFDRTNYFQTVPTPALDYTLYLESDRMGYLLGQVSQEVLDLQLTLPQTAAAPSSASSSANPLAEARIAQFVGWRHQGRAADDLLGKCVSWTWRVKLSLSTERDLFARLREAAEATAIRVFADNLRDLLLAAPAGPRVVLGLDPGIRTGVKVAVVDRNGKLVETATVYPHEPRKDWDGSLHVLRQLCLRHGVSLIAIGNGTASRETDKLAADLIAQLTRAAQAVQGEDKPLVPEKVVVSEAGASVYSASEFASQEMPDVDVSLRGAASIARRLQDPLAELVKIDPKSIGVGQYQHDVNQGELARCLDAVVEDCVNAVGVDLNTASAPLLRRVSGLTPGVAASVVRWRDANGSFRNRQQLMQVTGLGAKTFEQSAGFLRIRGGDNPLDMTGVHPETYPVVEKILARTALPVNELMGRSATLSSLRPEMFADAVFGALTVKDILVELEKPGRDPRPDFRAAKLNEGVQDISDLREGMVLEGTVSNVAAFGAFVDLGVHQDGLIHVSQLSDRFVTDAREVVKTGAIVKVRVLEVDLARKRISLTMKLSGAGAAPARRGAADKAGSSGREQGRGNYRPQAQPASATAMASAFARLKS